MKKIYEKPIFIKTMYISSEFIADDEENLLAEVEMFASSSGHQIGGGTYVQYVGVDVPCDCGKCPDFWPNNACVTVASCDC